MTSLLTIAQTVAIDAGKEILTLYQTTDFETKADGSPVTIADTRSNQIILNYLRQTDIPVLSEELDSIPTPYPSRLWIIDPLDGTKDFLNKSHDFSVMIGLLIDGIPELGVVYAPAHDVLYYAEKNRGAFVVRNGITTKLHVSSTGFEQLRFICSVNNFSPYMETVSEKLSAQKTPRGSIGVKAGVIAENQGEFFFSWGRFGEWDVCAPEIITREAGGTVTDCHGNPLSYGRPDHRLEHGILFSNTHCHAKVLEAIATTPHSAP